jgi:integrase
MISGFKSRRLDGGKLGGKELKPAHPRTVEHDFVALRNFLTYAVEEKKWITKKPDFPKWGKKGLPKPRRKALIEPERFSLLIQRCRDRHVGALGEQVLSIRNGDQLADFLLLLAYSGAREQEGMSLRWSHVDFKNRLLHIGAEEDFVTGTVILGEAGDTKTGIGREIEFNPQLEAHLLDMKSRRAPDSQWLFPSPRRGKKDIRVTTLRGALASAKEAAGVLRLGFHDMRHLFISYILMGKTPVGTVAKWVGHSDGGKLIQKTYSHLLKDHLREEAAKVQIGLSIVPRGAAAVA